MKRSFYFLAMSALAFTACTSEEVVDLSPQSNAIGFENAVMKASRANGEAVSGDLTNANFDQFMVYGYYTVKDKPTNPFQIFAGVPVTKKDGKWTYTDTRYWVPEATYNFFAYSCGDVALNNTFGTVGLSLNAGTNDRQMVISGYLCDQDHNHDLIVAESASIVAQAKTAENPEPNSNVSLKFSHVLSKIDAYFVSEFPSDYDVVIKDVKVVNFRNYGVFSSHNTQWLASRGVNDKETNKVISLPLPNGQAVARAAGKNADGTDKPALQPKTGSIYMIPHTYENNDVQLVFTLELYKGEEHTETTFVLSRNMRGTWSPVWEAGKYYTYKITLTGTTANLQPIVFESSVDLNDWDVSTSSALSINFSTN